MAAKHALSIVRFWCVATVVANAQTIDGPAEAVLERVIDGDTIKMRVAVWTDQELVVSVRIAGIDARKVFRREVRCGESARPGSQVFC